jgi:hypothetical protein
MLNYMYMLCRIYEIADFMKPATLSPKHEIGKALLK